MKMPQTIGLVHFIGIGGIGMSGIAEVLKNLGYRVQGSDQADGGAAWAFAEKGLTAEVLAEKIGELARNPALLEAAAAKALSLGRNDAAARLADLVEEVGGLKAAN